MIDVDSGLVDDTVANFSHSQWVQWLPQIHKNLSNGIGLLHRYSILNWLRRDMYIVWRKYIHHVVI